MGNFDIDQPLNQAGEHPADIMDKVAAVSAFLFTMISGDHVKPDEEITLDPDAVSGLAHILDFIHSAAAAAAETPVRRLESPRTRNESSINADKPMKKAC